MNDTSIIIKTFERPERLRRLIGSIRKRYPDIAVIVADDSLLPRAVDRTAAHICLPYDSGISRGRNLALRLVETPFVVTCDDDFLFTSDTRLEALKQELIDGNYDIIGGRVVEPGRNDYPQWFTMSRAGRDIIRNTRRDAAYPVRCDFVRNFFLARVEAIRGIGGWHEWMKVGEHLPFFCRAQTHGLRVAYTETATVDHDHRPNSPDYADMRGRAGAFLLEWCEKEGVKVVDAWKADWRSQPVPPQPRCP